MLYSDAAFRGSCRSRASRPQSNTISHYYVEQAGMLPSDPRRIANTHDLISVFQDLRCFVFVAVL